METILSTLLIFMILGALFALHAIYIGKKPWPLRQKYAALSLTAL